MIRMVHLLRRAPGLSLEAFHRRWSDDHGPLVAYHQTRLGIRRYTQTYRLDEPFNAAFSEARGGLSEPFDGISEVWWPSEAAAAEMFQGDTERRALREIIDDESSFIDQANSPLWLAHEYPQVSTSVVPVVARPMSRVVKLHFALSNLPSLTVDEAQTYWRTQHGPIIRSIALARGMLAYQQVHRTGSPTAERLATERGSLPSTFIGHAEAWFDRSSMIVSPETTESAQIAIADETRFIDFGRSCASIGKERVFVER